MPGQPTGHGNSEPADVKGNAQPSLLVPGASHKQRDAVAGLEAESARQDTARRYGRLTPAQFARMLFFELFVPQRI
jgi:hypothetical protein